jgi:hypothetical protein
MFSFLFLQLSLYATVCSAAKVGLLDARRSRSASMKRLAVEHASHLQCMLSYSRNAIPPNNSTLQKENLSSRSSSRERRMRR